MQQARALNPDIILLDIGLPGISGIEAARQIRELDSPAKVIFLTQECSPEVVGNALSMGAWGYVLKANAGSELVGALDSVTKERPFLGRGIETSTAAPSQKK